MQKCLLLLLSGSVCCLLSCSPRYSKSIAPSPVAKTASTIPDYSDLYYWAAHPGKADPSDSIPLPLRTLTLKDTTIDVFFLHPTSYTSRQDSGWNAVITDAYLNNKTDFSSILYQASAFNEFRVFAPRYRQAHIRSYYTPDSAAKRAFELAYADVKKAFQYYLEHYNNGRPVIIASHSQGSTHAQALLKEFFDEKEAAKKLVAAYIIGMYIPGDYFSFLKPCSDADDTGCFAGWRTYKNGYEPAFVTKEKGTGLVTNPLTWRTTSEYASNQLNKGGVATNFNQIIKGVADAQIHNGILWINRPRIPGSVFLKMKNFHIGDINLFYMNIRENLRERVAAYRSVE